MNANLKAALMSGVKKKEIVLSNGHKVTVRPMLLKELKLLTLGLESEKDVTEFMPEIIKSCIIEGNVNLDRMSIIDFEKLLFEIWKLGRTTPIIKSAFVCKNEINGKECGTDIGVDSNLNMVSLSRAPESLIKLNDQVSVKMRYPNVTESAYFNVENETDAFDLAWRLVEEVHFSGRVMKVGIDINPEELLEINGYISAEEFQNMLLFIHDMPRLVMDVAVKCPCCGHSEPVRLVGIDEIMFTE
ncbi:T4 family baseplate hub assembly chaperone [Aeromonas salmonicida]